MCMRFLMTGYFVNFIFCDELHVSTALEMYLHETIGIIKMQKK